MQIRGQSSQLAGGVCGDNSGGHDGLFALRVVALSGADTISMIQYFVTRTLSVLLTHHLVIFIPPSFCVTDTYFFTEYHCSDSAYVKTLHLTRSLPTISLVTLYSDHQHIEIFSLLPSSETSGSWTRPPLISQTIFPVGNYTLTLRAPLLCDRRETPKSEVYAVANGTQFAGIFPLFAFVELDNTRHKSNSRKSQESENGTLICLEV